MSPEVAAPALLEALTKIAAIPNSEDTLRSGNRADILRGKLSQIDAIARAAIAAADEVTP